MSEKFYKNMSAHFMRLANTDEQESICSCPMMMERIEGPSCYHGEIWLDKKYRGLGLSMYLPRMLMALAFVKWSPRYIFGLVPEKLAYCGICSQYGYVHIEPEGMVLRIPNAPLNHRWLAWMTMNDMHRLVQHWPPMGN